MALRKTGLMLGSPGQLSPPVASRRRVLVPACLAANPLVKLHLVRPSCVGGGERLGWGSGANFTGEGSSAHQVPVARGSTAGSQTWRWTRAPVTCLSVSTPGLAAGGWSSPMSTCSTRSIQHRKYTWTQPYVKLLPSLQQLREQKWSQTQTE